MPNRGGFFQCFPLTILGYNLLMNNFEASGEDRKKDEYSLTRDEISSIVEELNDRRLSADEDSEYFIITKGANRTFVPKRKYLSLRNENGMYMNMEISEYLRQKLDEY